jgi:hypothetical protein
MKKHAMSLLLQLGVECRFRTNKPNPHWRHLVAISIVLVAFTMLIIDVGPLSEPRWLTITKTERALEFLHSVDFPDEPFLRAQDIVEEAIGPTILSDPQQNPLRNCSVTTQFRLWIPPIPSDCWILQSFYGNGTPKPYGGDEIYVEWIAESNGNLNDKDMVTGVALVTDQQDGTYALNFVTPPLLQLEKDINATDRHQSSPLERRTSAGRLNVYYDYTCGIGSLVSPLKDRYARTGEVQVSFTQNDIPRPPPIRDFDPPNRDQSIDLSKYDHVYSFGDSLLLQLVRRYTVDLYWHPNLYYEKNVVQALSDHNETVSLLNKLRDYHGAQFRKAATANESVAVIVGSATWDVMRARVRPGFRAHLTACREFVQLVRAEFPYVDFYWKSPSAIFLHRRDPLADIDLVLLSRSRYISDSVPRQVYLAQKDLMRQMNVPFLDLFDAYYLSAPWSLKGVHYEDQISSLLLSYYWPDLDRDGTYTREVG